MNFDSLLNSALSFFHQYPIPVALGAVVLLFIVYKNMKASFKFVLLLLVLAAFLYVISLFSGVLSTGTKNADTLNKATRTLSE